MANRVVNQYTPEIVSAPGETLAEILEDHSMSQVELAERMGRPKKTISELINGKCEMTPETALQLERVLSIPASFWNNLERNYRDSLARKDEQERLGKHSDWPRNFPIAEMVRRHWIDAALDGADRVRALLQFFGVSSIDQWRARYKDEVAAFRLSEKFKPNIYALTAWLREGERRAQTIECQPFDADAFRQMLRSARAMTTE